MAFYASQLGAAEHISSVSTIVICRLTLLTILTGSVTPTAYYTQQTQATSD
jgi:hypothetical protein